MLIGATGTCQLESHVSLLLEVRGNYSFGEQASQVPENAGFYLIAQNPPVIQLGLISGYLDCLLKFEELEFLLDPK